MFYYILNFSFSTALSVSAHLGALHIFIILPFSVIFSRPEGKIFLELAK